MPSATGAWVSNGLAARTSSAEKNAAKTRRVAVAYGVTSRIRRRVP